MYATIAAGFDHHGFVVSLAYIVYACMHEVNPKHIHSMLIIAWGMQLWF